MTPLLTERDLTPEERAAIDRIREALGRLNSDDRLALLALIAKGYCTLCGDAYTSKCYCSPAYDA